MAKQKQPSRTTPAPLMCWDIFMDSYHRKMQLAQDHEALQKLSKKMNWQHRFDFEKSLFQQKKIVLVTDANLRIVYVSHAIFSMNGYSVQEVVGQRPNMFQGPLTCDITKKKIREAIEARIPFEHTVTNYRKNGELYECLVQGYPLFDASQRMVNFIAFESVA